MSDMDDNVDKVDNNITNSDIQPIPADNVRICKNGARQDVKTGRMLSGPTSIGRDLVDARRRKRERLTREAMRDAAARQLGVDPASLVWDDGWRCIQDGIARSAMDTGVRLSERVKAGQYLADHAGLGVQADQAQHGGQGITLSISAEAAVALYALLHKDNPA